LLPGSALRDDRVISRTHQVAQRLIGFTGHVDGLQLARSRHAGDLLPITPVGLDALAASLRNQRGRDHPALVSAGANEPLDPESARTGLIDKMQHFAQRLELPHHLLQRRPIPADLAPAAHLAAHLGNGYIDRFLVHIHSNEKLARLSHGLPPEFGCSLTDNAVALRAHTRNPRYHGGGPPHPLSGKPFWLAMTQSAKARRAGILCCHVLRNLAFYKSWYKAGQPFEKKQFWITANGNFLDIAVLEWCKLFVDSKGKHHFAKALADPEEFEQNLLKRLDITDAQFDEYAESFKTYRDKFIAHLDDENVMNIPDMKIARRSTKFLYGRLLQQEAQNNTFADAPPSAKNVYEDFLAEGLKAYEK
jgi:hypothetical protein